MSMKSTIEGFVADANKMGTFYEAINNKSWIGYYKGKAEAYQNIVDIMTSLGVDSFINPPKEYYENLRKLS